MDSLKTIIDAWVISYNPTESQKKNAELRSKVCETCAARKKIAGIHICKKCGCPVGKKIFSNKYNACPLKLWGDIDDRFFKMKKHQTII